MKSWQRQNYQNYDVNEVGMHCSSVSDSALVLHGFFRIKNWTYGYGFDIMFMSNWEVSAVDLYKKIVIWGCTIRQTKFWMNYFVAFNTSYGWYAVCLN